MHSYGKKIIRLFPIEHERKEAQNTQTLAHTVSLPDLLCISIEFGQKIRSLVGHARSYDDRPHKHTSLQILFLHHCTLFLSLSLSLRSERPTSKINICVYVVRKQQDGEVVCGSGPIKFIYYYHFVLYYFFRSNIKKNIQLNFERKTSHDPEQWTLMTIHLLSSMQLYGNIYPFIRNMAEIVNHKRIHFSTSRTHFGHSNSIRPTHFPSKCDFSHKCVRAENEKWN